MKRRRHHQDKRDAKWRDWLQRELEAADHVLDGRFERLVRPPQPTDAVM